jgi:hypothetical protein
MDFDGGRLFQLVVDCCVVGQLCYLLRKKCTGAYVDLRGEGALSATHADFWLALLLPDGGSTSLTKNA